MPVQASALLTSVCSEMALNELQKQNLCLRSSQFCHYFAYRWLRARSSESSRNSQSKIEIGRARVPPPASFAAKSDRRDTISAPFHTDSLCGRGSFSPDLF